MGVAEVALDCVTPPADSVLAPGIFSLVGEGAFPNTGVRNLPTLYFGHQPVFADRSLEAVRKVLREYVGFTLASRERAFYELHMCRFQGRIGLYGRDGFNRSSYRRALERLGFEFIGGPFVEFLEGGQFKAADETTARPSFALLGGSADDGGVSVPTPALLPFTLASYRLGPIPQAELGALVRAAAEMAAFGADEPRLALNHLVRNKD